MNFKTAFVALLLFASIWCQAQARSATTLRVASIYVTPDTSSAKLGEVERGREIILLENSREWLKVEANLTEERTVTGWITDKGVVQASTPK